VNTLPNLFDAGPSSRWGFQTSFIQRHQPAFWLFVVTVVITGLDFLSQQVQMLSAVPGAWLTTIVMLTPYAIPVIAVIYLIDTYEREPVGILVAAVAWGGIAATALSMYTNTPLSEIIYKVTGSAEFTQAWSPALTAPFVEEGWKALGVILLVSLARSEMDDLLDGFIWGAMVGIGFLLVEDVFYFVRAFGQSGDYGSLFEMFLIRILGAGPYSHFLYTGLSGMGIAYYTIRTDQPWMRRLLVGLGFAACGVGAHFLWNSPILSGLFGDGIVGFYLIVTVKGLPMLAGLVILVRLARRREQNWFASLTQTFNDDGSITTADLAELGGLRARRKARAAASRARGPVAGKLKGQIQREQIQLAMAMSRLGSEEAPEVAQRADHVRQLKAQLEAMPAFGGYVAGVPGAVGAASAWGTAPIAGPAAGPAPAGTPPVGWGAAPVAGPAPAGAAPTAAPAAIPGWGQPAPVAQPEPAPAAAPAAPAPSAAIPGWGQAAPVAQTEPAPAPVVQPSPEPAPEPVEAAESAPEPAATQPEPAPVVAAAQPTPVVQPAPVPQPIAALQTTPAAPVWTPNARVPDEGMPAWAYPDPSQQPAAMLAPRLDLLVAEQAGAWVRVVAVNGWTGWVDGRRLLPR
jgi:RsiW-degrading membrane proteinase PrsW (M82 family)